MSLAVLVCSHPHRVVAAQLDSGMSRKFVDQMFASLTAGENVSRLWNFDADRVDVGSELFVVVFQKRDVVDVELRVATRAAGLVKALCRGTETLASILKRWNDLNIGLERLVEGFEGNAATRGPTLQAQWDSFLASSKVECERLTAALFGDDDVEGLPAGLIPAASGLSASGKNAGSPSTFRPGVLEHETPNFSADILAAIGTPPPPTAPRNPPPLQVVESSTGSISMSNSNDNNNNNNNNDVGTSNAMKLALVGSGSRSLGSSTASAGASETSSIPRSPRSPRSPRLTPADVRPLSPKALPAPPPSRMTLCPSNALRPTISSDWSRLDKSALGGLTLANDHLVFLEEDVYHYSRGKELTEFCVRGNIRIALKPGTALPVSFSLAVSNLRFADEVATNPTLDITTTVEGASFLVTISKQEPRDGVLVFDLLRFLVRKNFPQNRVPLRLVPSISNMLQIVYEMNPLVELIEQLDLEMYCEHLDRTLVQDVKYGKSGEVIPPADYEVDEGNNLFRVTIRNVSRERRREKVQVRLAPEASSKFIWGGVSVGFQFKKKALCQIVPEISGLSDPVKLVAPVVSTRTYFAAF